MNDNIWVSLILIGLGALAAGVLVSCELYRAVQQMKFAIELCVKEENMQEIKCTVVIDKSTYDWAWTQATRRGQSLRDFLSDLIREAEKQKKKLEAEK